MKKSKSMPRSRYEARLRFLRALDLSQYDDNAVSLLRLCITHHKLSEYECNGCTRDKLPSESWEDYDKARDNQVAWIEKRTQAIEKTITKRCKELNLVANFEGDPRGCTCNFLTQEKYNENETKAEKHYPNELLHDQIWTNGLNRPIGADVWNW